MIARDTVLTLRDLRGEHLEVVRTIPWGTGGDDWRFFHTRALVELAGIALDWRKDDRYPVPEGQSPQRDDAVFYLVQEIAKVIADGGRVSFCQADCSVISSWEPVA